MIPLSKLDKLVSKFLAIESETLEEAKSFVCLPKSLIITTLPHSKPDELFFQRKNGHYTLTMMANPNFGLPYGSLPRLFLVWLTSEALNRKREKNKSLVFSLGKTFSEFLRALGLSKSGGKRGDATRMRDQMLRLFTTNISFLYHDKKKGACKSEQFFITRSFDLSWNPLKANIDPLAQGSTITLSHDFLCELTKSPVPFDLRVFKALFKSPLQIDIYLWLTHRFFKLNRRTSISWVDLKNQFGSGYANNAMGTRDFKKNFLKAFNTVRVFYHQANVEMEEEGIVLNPSDTHVQKKKKQGSANEQDS
jgi:hypothetical protein